MSIIDLQQFRSIKQSPKFGSYACFVDAVHTQNDLVFKSAWKDQVCKEKGLAKDTIISDFVLLIRPHIWHQASWACSKITFTLDSAVKFFEHYNNSLILNGPLDYYINRAAELLNTFDEALTQLEKFDYKYHYDNAVAVAEPVMVVLRKFKDLG